MPTSVARNFRACWPPTMWNWPDARRPLHHNDFSAYLHAAIEIDHVLVGQANATRRYVVTDRPGLVRAMDAVERRAEIERARAERIIWAAGHEVRQIRLALKHFLRRRPGRPLFFCRDVMHARPGESGPADADAVT